MKRVEWMERLMVKKKVALSEVLMAALSGHLKDDFSAVAMAALKVGSWDRHM